MSKWKCEICGLKFENFHAQGFNHKIYCPLCYYKQLYEINTKEIERLNNIINRIDNFVDRTIEVIKQQPTGDDEWLLERLNGIKYLIELKDSD